MQFLKSGNTLLIFLKGAQYSLRTEDARYNRVMAALLKEDESTVHQIMTAERVPVNDILDEVKKTLESLTVVIDEQGVKVDGIQMTGFLVSRVKDLRKKNLPYDHLINFLKRAFLNPKKFVIDELFDWLDRNDMPITDDGYFLAYKRVSEDYTDCHTGTVNNHVGNHLVFPMEKRTDLVDRSCECSSGGYHVCAFDYLSNFGGARTMVVKVDPQFVYSFPRGGAKIQVWEYDVVAELDIDKGDRIPDKIVSETGSIVHESDDDEDGWGDDRDADAHDDVVEASLTIQDLRDRFSFTILDSNQLFLFKLPAGSIGTTSARIIGQACLQHPGIRTLFDLIEDETSISGINDSIKSGRLTQSERLVYLCEDKGRNRWLLRAMKGDGSKDLFEVKL